MKVATVFLFLLFSFNLFGASVELQLATLNNKVQALTNKISAMKAFSRKAGRYELEHNGSKVVLRDN
ncbi:MAG: hypothetical protein HN623_05865, partial [Bdellovibrionales bacterium]|nr:hypothetical protein [Bdellovibrionales bacterium]